MCSASKNRVRQAHAAAAAQPATHRRQKRAHALSLLIFAAFAACAHATHAQTQTIAAHVRATTAARAAVPRASARQSKDSRASFDGERALQHVRKLVAFGPRPAGSDALKRARDYIKGELKSYGLKVSTDEFDAKTPEGERRMANISAEIKGTGDDLVVIASHYDTKLYKDFRFVGANDGGSSTGALLEIARVLSTRQRGSIGYRLVFFDGEEATCREWDECGKADSPDNTYGSRRHVTRLRERGELKRLRALVLLDMMGYEKLELGRDTMSTPWLVDIVWKTAAEIGYGREFASHVEQVGGDDHEPFLDAGVPSLDIIQLNTYPFWHTAEDTLDKLSARSLGAVGEVVLASLPRIEARLKETTAARGQK
ncbi:MAG: M28 family peptidase [Pyrinomonadaceae bacterium]